MLALSLRGITVIRLTACQIKSYSVIVEQKNAGEGYSDFAVFVIQSFFFSCSNNALRCRPSLMEINHFKCIIILIGGSYYFCQGEFHLQCIFVGSQ